MISSHISQNVKQSSLNRDAVWLCLTQADVKLPSKSWLSFSAASSPVFCFLVLCSGLYREVGCSVSQPFPRGIWALHVRPSLTTTQQLRSWLAPDWASTWRDCYQPRPGSAQSQSGAFVGPQQPSGDADGGCSEFAGRPPLLACGCTAGGERHPREIPVRDSSSYSFCNWCQQRGQWQPATTPNTTGVRWVAG